MMGCSSAERKAVTVKSIRDYIMGAIGNRGNINASCASHANVLVSRGISTMNIVSSHEAIIFLGNEITKVLCEGSTRNLTGEHFAMYAATVLVDGACMLRIVN